MKIEDKLDFKEFKKTIKQYKAREEEKVILNINVVLDLINKIDEQQAELEKEDKVINEMAIYMEQEMAEYQLDDIYAELHNCNGMERNWTRGKEVEIKDIKEYFTNKVEREGK